MNVKSILLCITLISSLFSSEMITLPIIKGNNWVYSYSIDSLHDHDGDYYPPKNSCGVISFTIDSIRNPSSLTDTLSFQLSSIDSGMTHQVAENFKDTMHTPYNIFSKRRYYVLRDSLITLDSIFSPGNNRIAIRFVKMNDTEYTYHGFSGLKVSRKTGSVSVLLGNTLYSGFTTITSERISHSGATSYSEYTTDDTTIWSQEIGLIYHSSHNYGSSSQGKRNLNTHFSLESFNGNPFQKVNVGCKIPIRTTCEPRMKFRSGYLFFTSPLLGGTTTTLFDLNGRMIFKTSANETSVKLSSLTANNAILWQVQNYKTSTSGIIRHIHFQE